jgi:hypothetical protein
MFTVHAADNFHFMDEDETYAHGEFATWAEAVAPAWPPAFVPISFFAVCEPVCPFVAVGYACNMPGTRGAKGESDEQNPYAEAGGHHQTKAEADR